MSIFVVITTINSPTEQIRALTAFDGDITPLIVGDNKTPGDWHLEGARFLSIADQGRLEYSIAPLLPMNHYCRKNLGYLVAMHNGATMIAETDDDNAPTAWPLSDVRLDVEGVIADGNPWVNVYEYFSTEKIWPRGYPLELILADTRRRSLDDPRDERKCSIHQYLAAGDPDVDAIYRLTVGKIDHKYRSGTVILNRGSIAPFNSQSTVWFESAFTYMYLPSFVSFRMTDIWRSFVAQVCIQASDECLAYHGEGVFQERNLHNLLKDFNEEVVGYQRNAEIVDRLLGLSLDDLTPTDRLRTCYQKLHEVGVVPVEELTLVDAWCRDLATIALGR